MNRMQKLNGVIPVVVTPLTAELEVDERSLVRLMEYLERHKIGGYWILGTGGEDMSLSYQQRLRVAEISTAYNDGRLPLILGSSFFSTTESKTFLKDTERLNFSAYHYMPYHTLVGLENIAEIYQMLAGQASRPLWIYTSANWTRFIPPDFIARLCDHPNIEGIKFSTSNAVHIEKALTYQSDSFQVLTAVVKQFLSSLSMGARAGTTVEACLFPNEVIAISERFSQGEYANALSAQRELNRKLESTTTGAGDDNFLRVAEIKYALSLKGICEPFVCHPYRMLDKAEREIIAAVVSNSSS